jgi:L,D-transpeptidase catalytic domain
MKFLSAKSGSRRPGAMAKNGGAAASISASRSEIALRLAFLLFATAFCFTSCAAPDTRHHVIISVPQQRMALLDNGALLTTYPVSTSKFAIGDWPGSRGTPLGELEIAQKIGGSAPSGAVFKDRRPTGEILPPDAPGRDPIVTRILWLRGREAQNANAYGRYIYIHGTPEERNIGRPASYGCVRMRSRDVIQLYDIVGPGAKVTIVNEPLEALLSNPNNATQASGGPPASH